LRKHCLKISHGGVVACPVEVHASTEEEEDPYSVTQTA